MKLKLFQENQLGYFPLYPSSIAIDYPQMPIEREAGFIDHQLFLVTKGKGILNIKDKTYTIEENDMFYLIKNIPHSYYGITDNFSTTFVSFFGVGFSGIAKYYNTTDYGIYKNKNTGIFKINAKKLFNEIDTTDNLSRICSLTFSLVISFFEEASKKESTLIQKVLSFLENNYNKMITLDDILTIYPYSKTKLSRDFKKKYNMTIFEMLNDIRLNYAKFMLDETPGIKLNTVISACGFNDLSYFCKLYKKKYGVSPKYKYR